MKVIEMEKKNMSKKMKKILFLLIVVLVSSISIFSIGLAYTGGVRGIGLIGIWFFLTCGITVVLAQLIPAGILLSYFVGEAFSSLRKGEAPVRAT